MKREMTCIVCPVGCSLVAEVEDGKVLSVSGNTCPRGEAYAKAECIAPMRTVTTTVKCQNGEVVPVKTEVAIPKEKIFDAMAVINKTHPCLPISVGDVIIDDVFGSRVVAAANAGGKYEKCANNCRSKE